MEFEWDPAKAATNLQKHGLSFEEASELLASDTEYLELFDDSHEGEERFIVIGPISRGVIVVVYTEREEDVIRIISARLATRRETRLFQQTQGDGRE